MTVKEWEAKRMSDSVLAGSIQPSMSEIILNVMPECGLLKREEIIHRVSLKTGIDKMDLQEHISNSLLALCRDNKLARGKTMGFYCKQRTA